MKNSITKFADASIVGLSAVVGGGGKCKTTKSKKKSGTKKTKNTGSKGKSSGCTPCW